MTGSGAVILFCFGFVFNTTMTYIEIFSITVSAYFVNKQTYIRTYIYYTYVYKHTYIHTCTYYIHTYIRTYYIRTYVHTYIQGYSLFGYCTTLLLSHVFTGDSDFYILLFTIGLLSALKLVRMTHKAQ